MKNIVWGVLATAVLVSIPVAIKLKVTLKEEQIAGASREQALSCSNVSGKLSREKQIKVCTLAITSGDWKGRGLSWAFSDRGLAYFALQDFDKAFADFNEAIRLDPGNSMAFNNRGTVYMLRDDPDRAMADFDEAIKLDPNSVLAHRNRAVMYGDKGDYERAKADYGQTIRLDPEDRRHWSGRAYAYLATGDYEHAIADLNKAIQLEPLAADLNNRGLVYMMTDKPGPAMADFDAALRLDPGYAPALSNRCLGSIGQGKLEPAIDDCTRAIAHDGKNSNAYFNRGTAYFSSGMPHAAMSDFARANELDPKNAYTLLWLEIASWRQNVPGKLGEAAAQTELGAWPGPLIRLFLGQEGREAVFGAVEEETDQSTKRKVSCEADFFLAQFALKRGEKDEAVRLLLLATKECVFSWQTAVQAELKALEKKT
jgi:tetratricopeptide (TPR) repeat protein